MCFKAVRRPVKVVIPDATDEAFSLKDERRDKMNILIWGLNLIRQIYVCIHQVKSQGEAKLPPQKVIGKTLFVTLKQTNQIFTGSLVK